MPPRFRLVHRASVALFVLLLLVVLADILLGWALPQPLRAALPWALAASLALALTLGIGAYGAPSRPERPPDPGDETPEAARLGDEPEDAEP